jgi:hypothetical protein
MIATMLHAGLRCAELLALRPHDIDLDSYLIRVVADRPRRCPRQIVRFAALGPEGRQAGCLKGHADDDAWCSLSGASGKIDRKCRRPPACRHAQAI